MNAARSVGFLLLLGATLLSGCCADGPRTGEPARRGDTVALVHGLGRTRRSMRPVENYLRERGYEVANIGYPSRKMPIEALAEQVGAEIRARCAGPERRVHVVTHSLGGILLRCYLKDHEIPNLGRVVMLGPPNQGSAVADVLSKGGFLRAVMGPAAAQLGTTGVPAQLGPVKFELGVIAGSASWVPFVSRVLAKPHDGLVSVESAQVEGMRDLLVVPRSHTFLMRDAEVLRQVECFLRDGKFDHGNGGRRTTDHGPRTE